MSEYIPDIEREEHEHPELIKLCLHCKYPDCLWRCPEYQKKRKELALAGEIKMCKRRVPHITSDVHDTAGRNLFEYKGTWYSIRQLAKMLGLPYQKLYYRLCHTKGDVEAAIDDKRFVMHRLGKIRSSHYEAHGESHTLGEWAAISGIPEKRLKDRIYHGHTIEEALAMGVLAHMKKGDE